MLKNITTIETVQGISFVYPEETYNLGYCENFTQVFGSNCLLYLLPIFSAKGDGVIFPIMEM